MPKRNDKRKAAGTRARATSPVTSRETKKPKTTYEGGTGYTRTDLAELYLLGVSNLGSEDTFYETAEKRDSRYAKLVRKIAPNEPEWMLGFLKWLRTDAFMRTAPGDGVVEAVHALVEAGVTTGAARQIASRVPGRSDEPGNILATWYERYGSKVPKPLKRGLAAACDRLYSEYAVINYDTDRFAVRFADVLEECHPTGHTAERPMLQSALYRYIVDRRHDRHAIARFRGKRGTPFPPLQVPRELAMVAANANLRDIAQTSPHVLLSTESLRAAGFTWNTALSLAGNQVDKAKLWAALAPLMGYEALLKNLRNMDEAGMADDAAELVAARLTDPARVERSRQFPMAFLAAYRAAPNLRWSAPLDKALTLSLANIPKLDGRTLVLIDTSGSMNNPMSGDSSLMRWDAAVIFGCAIAQRCADADVVSFSGRSYYHEARKAVTKAFPAVKGESLLKTLERFRKGGYFINGGTDTALALQAWYAKHDRVFVITDEQANDDPRGVDASIPPNVPMYTFNLAGYRYGHGRSGGDNRHTFGGLSDASFRMVPLLEAGRSAVWPWQEEVIETRPLAGTRTARV